MSEAKRCDRCGKYFVLYEGQDVKVNKIAVNKIEIGNTFRYDLCNDCSKELLKFMHIAPDPNPFKNQEEKKELDDVIRPDSIAAVIRNIEVTFANPLDYLLQKENTDNLTLSEKKLLMHMYDPENKYLMLDPKTEIIIYEPLEVRTHVKNGATKETRREA